MSAIMALALGLVYEVTKDTIAMRAVETTNKAYANVLQADDYSEQANFENDGTITKLSTATTGGQQIGYVAETTFSGAQGMITMVVGLDSDYNCTGVYVTKHSETSGLGAKAADTNEGAWRDHLVGQGDDCPDQGQGHIEAISGATITSRAVVNGAGRHQRGQVAGLRRAEI
ncbi:MAG: RnfABCDGE type electron transport complex subunit G [Oscillospiraceae bacterium]